MSDIFLAEQHEQLWTNKKKAKRLNESNTFDCNVLHYVDCPFSSNIPEWNKYNIELLRMTSKIASNFGTSDALAG